MTKRDIVLQLSEKHANIRQKDIAQITQDILDIIKDELVQGNNLELRNFGVFKIIKRKARIGRNPNNPSDVYNIPERTTVKFTPGRNIQGELNKLSS